MEEKTTSNSLQTLVKELALAIATVQRYGKNSKAVWIAVMYSK